MFPAVLTYVPFGQDPLDWVGGGATVVGAGATRVEVVARTLGAGALRETTVVDGAGAVAWIVVDRRGRLHGRAR